MSTERDFDRTAKAWLADGPSELADRVLDAALREVHLTHQRRRLPVPWRLNTVPNAIRLAGAGLVVVLALGALYLYLPGRGYVGGPVSTPTPSPTTAPSPAAVATPGPTPRVAGATVPAVGRPLTPGVRYVLRQFEPAFTFTASANFSLGLDAPANAWFDHPASPTGLFGFVRPAAVFAEGGQAETLPADIVTWLQARSDLVVSSVTTLTLGSATGTLLEGTVPADARHNGGNAINVFCPLPIARCDFGGGGSAGYAPGDHVLILVAVIDGQIVIGVTAAPEAVWATVGPDSDAFLRSVAFPN